MNNLPEQGLSELDIVNQLSKILGERDLIPEILLDKCKGIKDWKLILEHQKLLKEALKRDISIQAALLDYLLVGDKNIEQGKQIDVSIKQKVQYSSIIDPLTGLYNERHFQIIVDAELIRAKQFELPLTLLMLDLDNFGLYTALHGHESGDIMLNETGIILKKHSRKEDMLFRLRKNRYSVVLLNISRDGAHRFGERLRENLENHHFKGEDKLPGKKLTISGGIAAYPEDGKNSQTLILAAEEALSTAKQSGKNKILEYSIKRRKAPRIEIAIEAKYQIDGRKDIKPQIVYTKNLSESGILIISPGDIPLGGIIALTIKLPNGCIINPRGEITRISKKEGSGEITAAIKFTNISTVDFSNLKNYIDKELNKPKQ